MNVRKVVIGVLIASVMMGVPALAEDEGAAQLIDLSTYSDEEVVSVFELVQNEMIERKIEKSAVLEKGKYIGGKEIPVGSYILTKSADAGDSGIVWLRAASDPEDDYPSKLYEFVSGKDEASFFISVEEGDTLSLPFRVTLTISAGVKFQ